MTLLGSVEPTFFGKLRSLKQVFGVDILRKYPVANQVLNGLTVRKYALTVGLAPREREVISMVVFGLPNKRISGQLGTSENTVKVHRGRVMKKMQAQSRPDPV